MRKGLVVTVTCLLLLGLAAPAVAQRDPFQPAVGSGQGEGDTGTESEPETAPGEAPPPADRLADTGIDPQPWLVIAFALTAFGSAGLALARVWSTTSPKRS